MKKEEYLEFLGKKIEKLRQERGLSQEKLGTMIGTSRTQINRIEKGQQNPSILVLRDLCKAMDIKILELLGIED